MFYDLIRYLAGCRNRNGKTYSLSLLYDGCIDADHFAICVQQGTTRIAWVNSRISLNHSFEIAVVFWVHQEIAIEGTNHTCSYSLVLPQRVSYSNYTLSHAELI